MQKPLVWLVCPKCGVKEWLHTKTPFAPCSCGAARHIEDDNGTPYFAFSRPQNPDDWSVPPDAGSFDLP